MTLLAACSSSTPQPALRPAAVATKPAPATAVASLPTCVQLRDIREARVVDDRTIDFVLNDRRVLRNSLPNACPQLGSERAFTYSTSLSKLCPADLVTVVIQGGGPRTGASCGLGKFAATTPIPAK